jgi:hypothetical protein
MQLKKISLLALLLHVILYTALSQQPVKDDQRWDSLYHAPKGELIYADDFKMLDSGQWIAEIEPRPGSVYVQAGKLVLDTRGGVTVWFNKLLTGDVRIEYDRVVKQAGGKYDRVSDLNQFWMAEDPRRNNLFTRTGKFEDYDSLRLYYAGIGGNTNSTTRFRKYEGDGKKPLLQEYTDPAHLLQADTVYHITIIVQGNSTALWVNGQCYFKLHDPAILRQGYFGFRSTWSRQEVDGFRVYSLN